MKAKRSLYEHDCLSESGVAVSRMSVIYAKSVLAKHSHRENRWSMRRTLVSGSFPSGTTGLSVSASGLQVFLDKLPFQSRKSIQ